MKPEEKLSHRIDNALFSNKANSTMNDWEKVFLRDIKEILDSPYKTPSLKQKGRAHKILAKVESAL